MTKCIQTQIGCPCHKISRRDHEYRMTEVGISSQDMKYEHIRYFKKYHLKFILISFLKMCLEQEDTTKLQFKWEEMLRMKR
jgi:hypothetical protein